MSAAVEAFIKRWQNLEGGAERANYGMFLLELCDILGLPHPDVAAASTTNNDDVINALLENGGALNASEIAARFKQGQKIRPTVESVLTSLYRMGLVSSADGKNFVYRHAA